ncbi:MAG: sigma-70 family RNA polymerase sigma factor [Gammaproteobacteria bacterium]|nr:sigma-70 family RNA polymerase sigma factor [Gammaproteobacteria bacterium]
MLEHSETDTQAGHHALRNQPRKFPGVSDDKSDAELFAAFRDEGDMVAFETLFTRHKNAVYRYLWALSGSNAITEDVSQFCWLKLVEDTGAYRPRPGVSLRSYLYKIGRNRYIDEYQRKHVEKLSDSLTDQPTLVASGGSAYESAMQEETQDLMQRAIAELPFDQREVLALWLQGFSIKEMMDEVDAPRDTVLSRKKYALKKLRHALPALSPRAIDG